MVREDDRWVSELPSGIIKNPVLLLAACEFSVNDVVWNDNGVCYPVYDGSRDIFGIVASPQKAGRRVLIATKG